MADFVPLVEALTVGDPADDETDVGPVIDEDARERILEWIAEARAGDGAHGRRHDRGGLIRPTVIANPSRDDEGLVRGGLRPGRDADAVESLDEAIELANAHAVRAAGRHLHGDVRQRAATPRSELEFGGVTVNEAPTFRADQMPYGGVKDSGNTREGPAYAVRELTEERLVVVQLHSFGALAVMLAP